MELYEQIFNDLIEFNEYVNMRLKKDRLLINPVSVIPKNNKLWIFYTKKYESILKNLDISNIKYICENCNTKVSPIPTGLFCPNCKCDM